MPPNVPRKRTLPAPSPLDGDSENGDPFHRRQRTSSTTFIRAPIPLTKPKPSLPRVLKPTVAPTQSQTPSTTAASTLSTDVVQLKTRPPHPSGIPRPVASKVKSTADIPVTKAVLPGPTKPANESTLSAGTKPSSAGPAVGKALKPKETRVGKGDEMAVTTESFMDRLPSIPSPPPDPPHPTTAAKVRPATRSVSQPVRSEMKGAVAFPTGEPEVLPKASRNSDPPERPLPAQPPRDRPQHRVFSAPTIKPRPTGPVDCAHLTASDCEVLVSFAQGPHLEVWDIPDDGDIPCPAYLYIMAKDLSAWEGIPLALPDVTLVDIQCRTKACTSRFSNRQLNVDRWSCQFEGHEVPISSDTRTPLANLTPGTISVEMKWDRVYAAPTKAGPKGAPLAPSNQANAPPRTLSSILFDKADEKVPLASDDPRRTRVPGRGWCMKFWIPIPAHLFLRKETRTFEVDAEVFITPRNNGNGLVDLVQMAESVSTRTEMTVSHLRTERELDNMDFFY